MQRRVRPVRLTKSVLSLPKRKPTAHKGDHGRVLVIAGSSEYVGAAVLTANAAMTVLRTGVDLVTVAAPEHVALLLNYVSPSLITKKLTGTHLRASHFHDIQQLAKKADTLLIGPGIGDKSDAILRRICLRFPQQKVIDANALAALGKRRFQKVQNTIFTPHAHEFFLLTNRKVKDAVQHRIATAQEEAGKNVILLKGNPDVIAAKNRIALNYTGNATMTKGGTGDVLAGFCAGFYSRTRDPFRAACMAAYLNGAIGDWLTRYYGATYLAEDLIANVHKVWRIP